MVLGHPTCKGFEERIRHQENLDGRHELHHITLQLLHGSCIQMILEPFHFQDNPQNGKNACEGDRV